MTNKYHNEVGKEKDQGGDEKMVRRSVSVPLSLWQDARRKAGLGSLSAVIQKFLRLWVVGKINLDDYEED